MITVGRACFTPVGLERGKGVETKLLERSHEAARVAGGGNASEVQRKETYDTHHQDQDQNCTVGRSP